MRRPVSVYDVLLRFLGALAKVLFVTLFVCTVLAVLATIFGAGTLALPIYLAVWGLFWRTAVTILAIIAIVTMLDGLQ